MSTTQPPTQDTHSAHANVVHLHRPKAPRNVGLAALFVHALVSLTIGTYVFILVLFHDLSNDVALGLFGTIVGAHVSAAATVQLRGRHTDTVPDGG